MASRLKITLIFTMIMFLILSLVCGFIYYYSYQTFDEEAKGNLQRIKLVLLLSFFGGILITFVSGYFISKILLRPIRKIADQINIISAQSLEHRIKSGNRNDDWHYLTDTLNDLLNRLQESFEIQRRFISSASHELSTPLTSISSQLEVSLQRDRAAEEYRQVMQSAYQDVRNLIKLTQILLERATPRSASGSAAGRCSRARRGGRRCRASRRRSGSRCAAASRRTSRCRPCCS